MLFKAGFLLISAVLCYGLFYFFQCVELAICSPVFKSAEHIRCSGEYESYGVFSITSRVGYFNFHGVFFFGFLWLAYSNSGCQAPE